ncbi:MAG TPA: aquaporin [Thermoanaerobaculia bacterium]|nr:aquaporin [Thermoanaerobaculia bacterium]
MDRARPPLRLFLAELIGTALLVFGGLSAVIFMFGTGSPAGKLVPSVGLRRVITGFLFGSVGCAITLSPIGKVSGAHINPSVTLGFLLAGKLTPRAALGYTIAQLVGAVLGSLPLLLWGPMGRSVDFGATVPGDGYSTAAALAGEVITTFGLVAALCVFLGFRNLRRFTPFMIPFLFAVMVGLEAGVSGTSTNPARTLGPAVISGRWEGWWIYWAGPLLGTLAGILVLSFLAVRIEVAKLYHFSDDRGGVFRAMTERVRRRSATLPTARSSPGH